MSKTEKEEEFNCECLVCGVVKGRLNNMWYHLKNKHNQRMRLGQSWQWTTKPVTPTTGSRMPVSKTTKDRKVNHEMAEIVIPFKLRIPIVVGQPKIINE